MQIYEVNYEVSKILFPTTVTQGKSLIWHTGLIQRKKEGKKIQRKEKGRLKKKKVLGIPITSVKTPAGKENRPITPKDK